ncbi:putative GNAT family N-acetyltransferase [Paratrimastix pyriformis]|uniref:GNAT family N-acetyltransferase n=1 Tax=Paratrimastix pyriformis TaxID=342808 RepID=A0ABQ8UEC5_9EUKA|nr:putative GNAT family N-acetyltransferase [Paratrimastix pyriformis]
MCQCCVKHCGISGQEEATKPGSDKERKNMVHPPSATQSTRPLGTLRLFSGVAERLALPSLTTERLTLDAMKMSDSDEVERLAGNEAVTRTISGIPHPYPPGSSRPWIATHLAEFLAGKSVTWAIRLTGTGTLMGCIDLTINKENDNAEVGYWLGVPYWNHGYITEAARAVIQFGFEYFGLKRIHARHMSINPSSGRVMQKVGMTREGTLRRCYKKDGIYHDIVIYGILRSEWSERRAISTTG